MGNGWFFRLLDEGETVMLPNKQKILRYLTSLRARLEGVDMSDKADDVNSPASDHRISATYALNEQEESVSTVSMPTCDIRMILAVTGAQDTRQPSSVSR